MRIISLIILSAWLSSVSAGGDTFDIEVVSLNKDSVTEYHFKFKPLSAPYGQELKEFTKCGEIMTLIIKYGCNRSIYSCLIGKRSFNEQQHSEAIEQLRNQAIPGKIIKLGVLGSGFLPDDIKQCTYRSYGLVKIDNTVFSYENPFL